MQALFLKKWLLLPLAVLILFLSFLCIRPLFAETLDLASYNASRDADRYISLPYSGENFIVNSLLGYGAGRYYLKGKAAATVLQAYAALFRSYPKTRFIYAEMGGKEGGKFFPHRTHQHGLSADFITPVQTRENPSRTALLPCNAINLWGYGVRLDSLGVFEEFRMDAGLLIAHLAALKKAAATNGLRIERVILDPPLLAILRKHPDSGALVGISFMEKKAWFPHDGHYHVDFTVK